MVCTLGPATQSPKVLAELIRAGADVFRLNFSHGTLDTHAQSVALVRQAARRAGRQVAILLDLQGVKVRTTPCRSGPIELATGARLEIAGGTRPSDSRRIRISPAVALGGLRPGHRILFDDGRILLRALRRAGRGAWTCAVEAGGVLGDRKGVNLPDSPMRALPSLTPKDLKDIAWGVRQGVDLFALSFVRAARDVAAARKAIARLGSDIPVIAKIEKPEALADLPRILEESYGVMVARGDLGVEMPPEEVPVIQKRIIAEARRLRKPVITATQMLESMVQNVTPTRAEASDVANAVFDGTDAVMLSGETSIGKHPVEAARMMARILEAAEAAILSGRPRRSLAAKKSPPASAIAEAACVAAEAVRARCIIVYTHGGYSAAVVAGCRPAVPLFAFGENDRILRRLAVVWGTETRQLDATPASVQDLIARSERQLIREGSTRRGDAAAIVAGIPFEETGNTNFLKLHRIGEGT
jgi:pyruvate kinase